MPTHTFLAGLALAGLTFVQAATAAEPPPGGDVRALTQRADDPKLQWGPCPPPFAAGCQIAVLHGDPSKPNADLFLRVPAGYTIAPHSHTSAERMILVSGQLEVQYKGQPATVLKPGAYAYGPAKLPHVGHCHGKTPCTLFIAFELPVDAIAYDGALK